MNDLDITSGNNINPYYRYNTQRNFIIPSVLIIIFLLLLVYYSWNKKNSTDSDSDSDDDDSRKKSSKTKILKCEFVTE